jgi:hypothetical protein
MRETIRTTDDGGQSYVETTSGDAPSSIEVSVNAKGQGQVSVKLYFPDPERLVRDSRGMLAAALYEAKMALALQGMALAGAQESEARR